MTKIKSSSNSNSNLQQQRRRCRRPRLFILPLLLLLFVKVVASKKIVPLPALIRRGGNAASRWPPPPSTTGFSGQDMKKSRQQQQLIENDNTNKSLEEREREETKEAIDAFLTRDSRNTFIARTYGILAIQLLVTLIPILIIGLNPGVASWARQGGGIAVTIVSCIVSLGACFIFSTSKAARRSSPVKWQLLTVFTIAESLMIGFITSFYKFQVVLSALGATAAAATGVSLYTIFNKNSKYDLSQWGAGLSSALLIFVVYGFINLFLPPGFLPYREAIYSGCGAVLFSLYLAHHTKLIVAGKHSKYRMNEKDYVYAAITLYLDIINIFIYLLRILGDDKS